MSACNSHSLFNCCAGNPVTSFFVPFSFLMYRFGVAGGTGVQERISGLQQNGGARDGGGRSFERTTTLPIGSRSCSPDAEGVQVAEMSKAAIVRDLTRRLQDLRDAKAEAEARQDAEEVARSVHYECRV